MEQLQHQLDTETDPVRKETLGAELTLERLRKAAASE
jgi:hypothetical protein